MSYNLFLDDERQPACLGDTRTWEVVRSYQEFVSKVNSCGLPQLISFDHDLSGQQYTATDEQMRDIIYSDPLWKDKTGYACAYWLINYCRETKQPLPKWQGQFNKTVG